MTINTDERRALSKKHFAVGLASKLAEADPVYAMRELHKAWEIACLPSPLSGPWPSITAYRLAHLKLRACNGETDLIEIEQLLSKILSDQHCPPEIQIRASVMRVATVQRLHYLLPERFPIQEVQDELDRAISCRNEHFDAMNYSGAAGARPVQEPWLNFIELAGYFTGGDMHRLRRRGVTSEILSDMGANSLWYIVGNQGITSDLLYTEALAKAELNALIENEEVDIAFRAERKSGEMLLPKLPSRRKADGPGSIPASAYKAMGLACVTNDPDIWRHQFPDFGLNAQRTRDALNSVITTEDRHLFSSARRDGVYQFGRELRVAAMVKADCLPTGLHFFRS